MDRPQKTASRFGWMSLVILASVAVAGCGAQTERVYFKPVGTSDAAGPAWVAEGRYRLPPGTGLAEASISARGTIEKSKEAGVQEWIGLKFQVQNRGPQAFSIDPAKVRLMDDDGNQIGAAPTASSLNPAAVVPGGTKTAFELTFMLPGQVRLANIGSIRVAWPYTYGEKPYEITTKFLKIEEVNYYEPGYYYGGWYYGPYYDPWYGPYGPYGPYGTWSHRYYDEDRRRR
jgi:hypothetical protein